MTTPTEELTPAVEPDPAERIGRLYVAVGTQRAGPAIEFHELMHGGTVHHV